MSIRQWYRIALLGVCTAACTATPTDALPGVGVVDVVAVSEDGAWLAVGARKHVQVHRVGVAGMLFEPRQFELPEPSALTHLAVTADPLRVAVGGQGGLACWTPEANTFAPVDSEPVLALAVRGREFLVGAYPASIGKVKIDDLKWTDCDLPPGVPMGVALLPDGGMVVGDDRGLLTMTDATGQTRKIECGAPIDGVLVTRDGDVLVGGDKYPRLVKSGAEEKSEQLGKKSHECWIRRMALSGNGQILATTDGADVRFFDVAARRDLGHIPAGEPNDRVLDLALSYDGNVVFVAWSVSKLLRQAWRSEAEREPGR